MVVLDLPLYHFSLYNASPVQRILLKQLCTHLEHLYLQVAYPLLKNDA